MADRRFNPTVRGNFIGGEFRLAQDPNGEWLSRSPADTTDEIGRFQYSYAAIEEAVRSAREAFRTWRMKTIAERMEYLGRLNTALERRHEEVAEVMAREIGKPLWESKGELQDARAYLMAAGREGLRFIQDFEIERAFESAKGVCRYKPHGVAAVVGPFNLPIHLPFTQLIPALVTGNSVIFKPSEKAPMTSQLLAECFQEAGFPAGVFNLLQGEKEVGRRLCAHEGVDAIFFTGSYEVGLRIKQDTLLQHWKALSLQMGGKNSTIVWEDADLDSAVYEILVSAFVTAGQRCNSTSRVLVHEKLFDSFVESLHQRAKEFRIGHPLENPFMGPLVDSSAVDRYMKFLGIAAREGCELVMRGKILELERNGNYVTPSIAVVKQPSLEQAKKSVFQQTEAYAPCVSVQSVHDLDEAIAQANITQYGLTTSVFCREKAVFQKCLDDLVMGSVHWNRSTVDVSPLLPYGGLKKSGNHFPGGVMSTLYCTSPVGSLEQAQPPAIQPLPGLNWE